MGIKNNKGKWELQDDVVELWFTEMQKGKRSDWSGMEWAIRGQNGNHKFEAPSFVMESFDALGDL